MSGSASLNHDIISAAPHRIAFNSDAENPQIAKAAKAEGIAIVHGCTPVMLQTRTF
jgi:hypothetical protein